MTYVVYSNRAKGHVRIHLSGCGILQRAIGLSDSAGDFEPAASYDEAFEIAKLRKKNVGAFVIAHCDRCRPKPV